MGKNTLREAIISRPCAESRATKRRPRRGARVSHAWAPCLGVRSNLYPSDTGGFLRSLLCVLPVLGVHDRNRITQDCPEGDAGCDGGEGGLELQDGGQYSPGLDTFIEKFSKKLLRFVSERLLTRNGEVSLTIQ